MTSAERCRKNGWTVGTRLAATGPHERLTIEITAIGRELVLACASENGREWPERSWDLAWREWVKVEAGNEPEGVR